MTKQHNSHASTALFLEDPPSSCLTEDHQGLHHPEEQEHHPCVLLCSTTPASLQQHFPFLTWHWQIQPHLSTLFELHTCTNAGDCAQGQAACSIASPRITSDQMQATSSTLSNAQLMFAKWIQKCKTWMLFLTVSTTSPRQILSHRYLQCQLLVVQPQAEQCRGQAETRHLWARFTLQRNKCMQLFVGTSAQD